MGSNPFSWGEHKVVEAATGAWTADTPQVSSSPMPKKPPAQWKAPDVSHPGNLHVSTGDLTSASDVLKASLPELDNAISMLQQHESAMSSLSGWQAGNDLQAMYQALVQQCVALTKNQSTIHLETAQQLKQTAATYDAAEKANADAAKKALQQQEQRDINGPLIGAQQPPIKPDYPYVGGGQTAGNQSGTGVLGTSGPGGTGGTAPAPQPQWTPPRPNLTEEAGGAGPSTTGWS